MISRYSASASAKLPRPPTWRSSPSHIVRVASPMVRQANVPSTELARQMARVTR